MPGSEHIGCDTDGLNTKRVLVDLALRVGSLVEFEPEEEVVLEGECFNGCADGGPEKENPA